MSHLHLKTKRISFFVDAFDKLHSSFRWEVLRPLQRFFTGYSFDMKWNASSAMAEKIYPIFKAYAEYDRQGVPTTTILLKNKAKYTRLFDKERVERYLTGSSEDEEMMDALCEQWEDIVSKVLFALEHVARDKEEYPEHLSDPNPQYNPDQKKPFTTTPVEGKEGFLELHFNIDYGETELNVKRVQKFEDQVSEGFRLLGEYWRAFWD